MGLGVWGLGFRGRQGNMQDFDWDFMLRCLGFMESTLGFLRDLDSASKC